MEFFYKKEIDLGKENNFAIDLSKSNTVEGQKITKDIDLVEDITSPSIYRKGTQSRVKKSQRMENM